MAHVDVQTGTEIRSLVDGVGAAELSGDWDRWQSLHAQDVIMDYPVIGAVVGVAENLAIIRAFRSSADEYRRDIFDVVCHENRAAYRFSITGVFARPFNGDTPASGSFFEVAGASFVDAWGGKIVRVVNLYTTNTYLAIGG